MAAFAERWAVAGPAGVSHLLLTLLKISRNGITVLDLCQLVGKVSKEGEDE